MQDLKVLVWMRVSWEIMQEEKRSVFDTKTQDIHLKAAERFSMRILNIQIAFFYQLQLID